MSAFFNVVWSFPKRDIVTYLAILTAIIPQVVLKPASNDISVIDLFAPFILFVAFFHPYWKMQNCQKLLIIFLIYVCEIFFIKWGTQGWAGYGDQAGLLLRTTAIFCPLFLVPYLPPQYFPIAARLFSRVGALMMLIVAIGYLVNPALFNAHQTYLFIGSDDLTHRLGGIVGETGGFAFNCFIVFGFGMIFLVLDRSRSSSIVWLSVLLVGYFLAYQGSVARVMVLNFVFFALFIYCSSLTLPASKLFIPLVCAFSLFFLAVFVDLSFADRGLQRFNNIDGVEFNKLSSGRLAHWINVIELWNSSISNQIFGIGNRMTVPILNHVVENIFLYHLLEYGAIGAILFLTILWLLLWPLLRGAISGNRIAIGMSCLWGAILLQWMFNDLNTFYQTFPSLLLFTGWCGRWLRWRE